MGYDDRREILERLEALERRVGGGRGEREHGDHHRGHRERRHRGDDRGGEFEEKRIIDTIVRLVGERVSDIVEEQLERTREQRNGDGGNEKRIVDLIVGLVAEHVQEIVATELDKRLGAGPPSRPPEQD